MKKQKKRLLLGMALAGIVAMAGCGAESGAAAITEGSAEEYVQAAKEALTAADSFTAEFQATVSMEGTGETVTDGKITLVKEPLYVKVDTKMDFASTKESYAVYLEESGDAVNQYMNYDGQWTEMTMTEENALSGIQVYNTPENMEIILSAAENWSVSRQGDTLTLTGVIPEGKVHTVENSGRFFQLAGMSGLSEVYFSGVGDVPVQVTVDGKTGAPLSYEIDLTKALEVVTNNVLTELGGGTLEEGIAVKTHVITSTLTQLGGVTAEEIPPAAKSDAINYEKEISLLEEAK
ncbi:MAG: outer membrane lipoprotein carrier protein LolA [Anaerotignum sp.]